MKELSQIIDIHFLLPIWFDSGRIFSLALTSNNSTIVSEKTSETKAGTLYDQSMRVVVDKEDYPELEGCIPSQQVVVSLSDCSRKYAWGNKDIPVTMTITPSLLKYQLEFKRQDISPLFK